MHNTVFENGRKDCHDVTAHWKKIVFCNQGQDVSPPGTSTVIWLLEITERHLVSFKVIRLLTVSIGEAARGALG